MPDQKKNNGGIQFQPQRAWSQPSVTSAPNSIVTILFWNFWNPKTALSSGKEVSSNRSVPMRRNAQGKTGPRERQTPSTQDKLRLEDIVKHHQVSGTYLDHRSAREAGDQSTLSWLTPNAHSYIRPFSLSILLCAPCFRAAFAAILFSPRVGISRPPFLARCKARVY